MQTFRKREEYIPLSQRDATLESNQGTYVQTSAVTHVYPPQSGHTFSWTALVFVAFVVADLSVVLYVARLLHGETAAAVENLQYRNPYIGLKELYDSKRVAPSDYHPIANIPRIAAQIDKAQPDKVFPDDVHRSLSDLGTLSPPERHLQLSENVHTILQFRAIDFGMENCALTLRLPSRTEKLPYPFSLDEDSLIKICALDFDRPLDVQKLSWSTRPSCVRNIGTFVARSGQDTELPSFLCPWGSLHTYEVSCSHDTPPCGLDVWSDHNQTWGLYLQQASTL